MMKIFENELDKLRYMLDEANIPYETFKEEYDPIFTDLNSEFHNGNGKYKRNQIIYGRYSPCGWRLDGICQIGSYGYETGLIETYGDLGVDEEDNPMVLTAKEVFNLILIDWNTMEDRFKNDN